MISKRIDRWSSKSAETRRVGVMVMPMREVLEGRGSHLQIKSAGLPGQQAPAPPRPSAPLRVPPRPSAPLRAPAWLHKPERIFSTREKVVKI
jgi:hypothetical protein